MTADIAYGIRPAGHGAGARRSFKEASSLTARLLALCDEAVHHDKRSMRVDPHGGVGADRFYGHCLTLLGDLVPTVEETNLLFLDDRMHSYPYTMYAGIFTSACWERSGEKIVQFDFDVPEMYHIGYKFKGTIINKGTVGFNSGSGVTNLVNFGEMGGGAGQGVRNFAINFGYAEAGFGHSGVGEWNRGIYINAGATERRFLPDEVPLYRPSVYIECANGEIPIAHIRKRNSPDQLPRTAEHFKAVSPSAHACISDILDIAKHSPEQIQELGEQEALRCRALLEERA
jgi:hypothetical protein